MRLALPRPRDMDPSACAPQQREHGGEVTRTREDVPARALDRNRVHESRAAPYRRYVLAQLCPSGACVLLRHATYINPDTIPLVRHDPHT